MPSSTVASRRRRAVLIGLATTLHLALPATGSAVTLHTYRTGLDTDNAAGTGCGFSLGAVAPGTLPGFELQVTVVVDNDLVPPAVVSAQVETCTAGVFASPQPLPGFVLQLDSGVLGADSVVGSIPLALLGNAAVVRLAHHAQSASGSQDALFTIDGSADGAPIVLRLAAPPAPAPLLSHLGTALLLLLLIAVAWPHLRRVHGGIASTLAVLAMLGAAVVVHAAFGDPVASDDQSDAAPSDTRAEIFAAFIMVGADTLALRLDIEDIPVPVENCADGNDNDSDGLADCLDPNCSAQSCSDGDACTVGDTCAAGLCTGSPMSCDDGNACTQDSCSAGMCISTPVTPEICTNSTDDDCDTLIDCSDPDCAAAPCNDGIACTESDTCTAGVCAGAPIICDDSNPCTSDACVDGACTYSPDDENPNCF